MEAFLWNMVISYQLLFIVISSVVFIIAKDKSFKYYSLYNFFLIFYILSRYEPVYDGFENFVGAFIGAKNSEIFTSIFCFLIQVFFYNLYTIFVLYFLDLNKHTKKYFNNVKLTIQIITAVFIGLAVVSYVLKDAGIFKNFYTFLYIPVMLALFFPSFSRVYKYTGNHKYYLIIGVFMYIAFALIAFAGSNIASMNMKNPISWFYAGIVIETIFFSLGLAYKVKILNDEKNRIRNLVTHHRHNQHISKIHGLLEGEEKEKKRMAAELHDGIAGDLSAIKFNLAALDKTNQDPRNKKILKDVTNIIDKSCVQIREISHNLSPSSIINLGLVSAVEEFCKKIETTYNITCQFIFEGDDIKISTTAQTHIYRIIQELVNNIVKHSEAKLATVKILYNEPHLSISVEDDGKGFAEGKTLHGIGLNNIGSRVRILNAVYKKEPIPVGTSFNIKIDTDKIAVN